MSTDNATTVALSRVDMPTTPLVVSSEDVAHYGARVSVHLLDKSKHTGYLEWFSASQQMIVLRVKQPNGEDDYSQTPFSNIARMIFAVAMPLQHKSDKSFSIGLHDTASKPRPFRISLLNGEIIQGELRSYIEDENGLHLFQSISEDRIVRMFVPSASIKDHRIGDYLGETLIKKDVLDENQLEQSLEKQQALRSRKLGDYLKQDAVINQKQLETVLNKQTTQPKRKLGEILIDEGLVTTEQLQLALTRQKQDRSQLLGSILEEMGVVSEDDVASVIAKKVGTPVINLRKFDVDPDVTGLIPADIASKHLLMPLCFVNNRLAIASRAVLDTELQNTLRLLTGRQVELYVAGGDDIRWAIQNHYQPHPSVKAEKTETKDTSIDTKAGAIAEPARPAPDSGPDLSSDDDKPMARLLNNVIGEAYSRHASDIHISPMEKHLELHYRIDGVLFKIRSLAKSLQAQLVAYTKKLAGMNTTDTGIPQEGRCQLSVEDTTITLRISVIPSVFGESIAIRVRDTNLKTVEIAGLGLNDQDREKIEGLLKQPSVIILVTGSTGCGISTSLYAMINKIKEEPIKIITVEKPVEQHMTGIEQMQVNTDSGFTFAVALRSILHHDPDAIMISEIRDRECASIAVESAHDGHLVLGSMHTKSSAATISRLLHMGVERYLLQSTPLAILSQRLVRKNCTKCMKQEKADKQLQALLKLDENEIFYKGEGCQACGGTGYHGRILAYELLVVNSHIAKLISEDADDKQIQQAAIESGMVPLVKNALAKARDKLTSLDEIHRVCLD